MPHAHGSMPQTILVVEDSEPIRKMVCVMLLQSGYACLEAADGLEALQVIEDSADNVHLVITDVVMPNMTGGELALHLAQIRPDMRIIFTSGYTEDPIVQTMAQVPDLFLPKPFTAAVLMERVREVLDRPWSGLPAPTGSQA
jgi:two-component system cell cycle sensor histidine kinase/response regulator CckA